MKAQQRKMQKLLSVLYKEDREHATAIEKYIGLVGEPVDSLVKSEGKKRSLMFSYKDKATGAELLEKSDKGEDEELLRIMRSKENGKKVDDEKEKADEEKMAREVRKLQDMDVQQKKKRQEKEEQAVDTESEYMMKIWEETAKEASQLIKHKFSKTPEKV